LPEERFTHSLLPWLAFGALSSNVAMDFLLNTALKGSRTITKYVWPVVIIWGPILIAIILSTVIQWWKRGKASKTASRHIIQD
jgi:hypothetical protein